jgi:Zn-dependent peptidase ImmA (M78 family)
LEFIRNLAKSHKLQIKIKDLGDGPRAYLMDDVVCLDESLPQERKNFAFCHELAHRLLDHHVREVLSDEMEHEANLLATDLLLPPDSFRRDAMTYHLDRLKELYPQASWEVIARARLVLIPAVLTILDNGQRTLRMAPNGYQYPYHLLPVEHEVFRHCIDKRQHYVLQEDAIHTHGFFVDNGTGVLRVILWTEIEG